MMDPSIVSSWEFWSVTTTTCTCRTTLFNNVLEQRRQTAGEAGALGR